MKQTRVVQVGGIGSQDQLVRMWDVYVPGGKRPFQHHRHFSFEIMYVSSGTGTYSMEGREYPMRTGDVFVFCCNELHSITDVGKEGLKITNLQFAPQFIRENSAVKDTGVNMSFCFSHGPEFHNRIGEEGSDQLLKMLYAIRRNLEEKEPEYRLYVKALIQILLIWLVRYHRYGDNGQTVSRERMNSIQGTLRYIDDHFTEEITLKELADLAGLTPTYFSTVFKKVTGITLWEYLSFKRIDMAARLLAADSDKNMIEIAYVCGFHNTANFNKTFRKVMGITPSEYKKGQWDI